MTVDYIRVAIRVAQYRFMKIALFQATAWSNAMCNFLADTPYWESMHLSSLNLSSLNRMGVPCYPRLNSGSLRESTDDTNEECSPKSSQKPDFKIGVKLVMRLKNQPKLPNFRLFTPSIWQRTVQTLNVVKTTQAESS